MWCIVWFSSPYLHETVSLSLSSNWHMLEPKCPTPVLIGACLKWPRDYGGGWNQGKDQWLDSRKTGKEMKCLSISSSMLFWSQTHRILGRQHGDAKGTSTSDAMGGGQGCSGVGTRGSGVPKPFLCFTLKWVWSCFKMVSFLSTFHTFFLNTTSLVESSPGQGCNHRGSVDCGFGIPAVPCAVSEV